MSSSAPVGRARHGAHRTQPRRIPRPAVVTLAAGLALAVTSLITAMSGRHESPVPVASAAPLPVASVPVAPRVAAPAHPRGAAPRSVSMGALITKPARLLHVPPTEIGIPAVGIKSTLVGLALNPDRTLQPPADYRQAGWYAAGSYPGDADGAPAVIAGHVDSWNGPAVFYQLQQVKVGQEVRVTRADGSVAVFDVYAARRYPKDAFPADAVYAPTAAAEIRVITCTGTFDKSRRSYLDNLVLFARLNPAASQSAP